MKLKMAWDTFSRGYLVSDNKSGDDVAILYVEESQKSIATAVMLFLQGQLTQTENKPSVKTVAKGKGKPAPKPTAKPGKKKR